MATNIKYADIPVKRELNLGGTVTSGTVTFVVDMPVLALEDTVSNVATCMLIGVLTVVELSVVGADGSGNSAVAIGDKVYKDGSAYNVDDANGKLIGYALGAVSSGATTSIEVALIAS